MSELKPYVLPLNDGTTSTVLLNDEDAKLRGLEPVTAKQLKVTVALAKEVASAPAKEAAGGRAVGGLVKGGPEPKAVPES